MIPNSASSAETVAYGATVAGIDDNNTLEIRHRWHELTPTFSRLTTTLSPTGSGVECGIRLFCSAKNEMPDGARSGAIIDADDDAGEDFGGQNRNHASLHPAGAVRARREGLRPAAMPRNWMRPSSSRRTDRLCPAAAARSSESAKRPRASRGLGEQRDFTEGEGIDDAMTERRVCLESAPEPS